jgi:ATP-binding cassette subfamily C protein LapB
MDAQSETQLIERLKREVAGRTLVMVSHRVNLLQLVERIVVVDGGKIVQDGPRDQVLQNIARARQTA